MPNRAAFLMSAALCIVPAAAWADDVTTSQLPAIVAAAKAESHVATLAMTDDWANFGATWKAIQQQYGITHSDTDMSSAEEIFKLDAEKNNASADMGTMGIEFGPIVVSRKLVQPFKPEGWSGLPDWAKDPNGQWTVVYTGTIAFLISKDVKNPPKSWADLLKGDYRVSTGDVGKSAQSNASVLAAAVGLGGSETNLQPALDLYAKLAEQKRLTTIEASPAVMEKGETQVAILWDFSALGYRDIVGRDKFDVVIPSDGSITSGYLAYINAYAKHPNAAKLSENFMLSDEGQANFANGYARPIRADKIVFSAETKAKLLPQDQYAKARPLDVPVWSAEAKKLPALWRSQVLSKM